MPSPRAEPEAILAALRGGGDPGRARDLLRRAPDWTVLLETARDHGVLPFFHARVKEIGEDCVPAAAMARMDRLCSANARRNLFLGAELLGLLIELGGHGIVAVPLKGPALAETAYGDIALRAFSDLDVLVRRDDVLRVRDLLVARGFRPVHAFTRRQEKAHLSRTCEFTLEAKDGSFQVDVHWRFAADYIAAPLDAEAAFERRVPGSLLGRPVPALADEDALLHLCLHGTFHFWERLALVCDVAKFLESRTRIDWPALSGRAAGAGLGRILLLGVSLARDLLGAPVPPELVRAADGDRAVVALRAAVGATIARRPGGGDTGLAERALLHLRCKERLADKARYCLIRSFLPSLEDWIWLPLPDALYFLYFLLRPVRLAQEGFLATRQRPPAIIRVD